jgi:hypothetical protein
MGIHSAENAVVEPVGTAALQDCCRGVPAIQTWKSYSKEVRGKLKREQGYRGQEGGEFLRVFIIVRGLKEVMLNKN